jgi:phage terminase large subunit-like protein
VIEAPHPLDFFDRLVWLDGRPLLATIEPYRREIFTQALHSFDDGRPTYTMALCGRGKKNWKTADLVLAALYRFLVWPSTHGSDCSILANDEAQAGDDLSLAKKIIYANPELAHEVSITAKAITRLDGQGVLEILPARDAVGAHGKSKLFIGFDEIHGYRSHDLFEALAPDPTRVDALTWVTSYAGIRHAPGIPLYDFMKLGKSGEDPRFFFSWYSGDYTTDAALAEAEPEQRANPSMASWPNADYLAQQRRRLPTHKFRRLHLNLPGAPDGAAFDGDKVMAAIVAGRKRLSPEDVRAMDGKPVGWVDMSGGSSDEAVVAVAFQHPETKRGVLACLEAQTGKPPFNPRAAVHKFAGILREYGLTSVMGDAYAGQTFRLDFAEHGIEYKVSPLTTAAIYDAFEPKLNAGEVELLDQPEMTEQYLTLVVRGSRIDHQPGDHDDRACAASGALWRALAPVRESVALVGPQTMVEAWGAEPSPLCGTYGWGCQ